MHQHLLYIIVTSLLLYALPAESKENIESLLNEFKSADSNYSSNRKQTAAAADKKPYKEIFSASGSLGLETVFNTAHKKPAADKPDQRRFSSLKTRLDLDLRVKLMRDWRFYISGSGWHDLSTALREGLLTAGNTSAITKARLNWASYGPAAVSRRVWCLKPDARSLLWARRTLCVL